MASPMPKQLGELLQEQQEPFTLEIFLLERGYSKSNLKKSASWRPNKKRKVIPSCSKIVKAVLNKIVPIRNTHKVKNLSGGNGNSGVWDAGRSNQETAEYDRFSSSASSSPTVFYSCPGSDIEDRPNLLQPADSLSSPFKTGNLVEEKEVVADRELQWRCREDSGKELRPVSVLEEIPSKEVSPIQNYRQRNARTRDTIVAVPFCKFIFQPSVGEPSGIADPSSQYLTAKRVLQQSKQLLFDCVRELVETRGRGKQTSEHLGPEEIGKLLSEDMRTWSNLSGNETNTTQLLNSDLASTAEEWSDFKPQGREIGAEIGDAILEDISKEIVEDMIGNC